MDGSAGFPDSILRRPLVLSYNRAFGSDDPANVVDCAGAAELTSDRACLRRAAAVVFHIPTLSGIELPPKHRGQKWVAWSMESEVNYPELADPGFMRNFEITMTYRRGATVWFPYFDSATAAALCTPPSAKSESSPLVYFRSSQVDQCGRTAFAAELMRRVKIDSYGRVLRNRNLTVPDAGRETLLMVMARYKFGLALENSVVEDYVSEKFFDALIAGAVPVYRGAPNISDFAPGDRCFIDASDFTNATGLAAYLYWLNGNSEAYDEYHAWRQRGLRPEFRALVESVREPPFRRLCRLLRPIGPSGG